ncbi:hypothetical protein IFR05_014953 [Cadophora sp. M221]|nr:hypothetical protein IFR05_014953 [Cadophora sp. M221]
MARIYGSGRVSIAVKQSSNCRNGFLISKNEEQDICFDRMVKISNTLPTGEASNLYASGHFTCKCVIRKQISPRWDTELSQRGWTFQERFLAPRILHFIGSQMLWECCENHGIPPESGIELKNVKPLHPIQLFFGPVVKSLLHSETPVEEAYLLKHWYEDVVPEFSKRTLSHVNDKLPAIAGVAKVFQERLKYTYTAGLWVEDIAIGLCWFRSAEMTDKIAHSTDYRAPTLRTATSNTLEPIALAVSQEGGSKSTVS